MNLFDLIQTIFNFFSVVYIHRFMLAFFDGNEKRKNKLICLTHLVYPLSTTIVYFWLNYPIVNLIVNLLSLFIISLQYRSGIGQRIISIGLIFFSMISMESLCAVISNYIGASAFKTGTYENIVGLVMCNLMLFVLSLIIYHLKKLKRTVSIPKSLWFAISGIPILSIAAILISLHMDVNQVQAVTIIVVLLIINGFTFYLYDALISSYDAKLQSALLAEEKECYYTQCLFMKHSEKEMNEFRHDVRNQLDMIYEIINNDTSNKVVKEIAETIEKKINNNVAFSNTGNIALDSILNLKLSQAKQKNISVICNSEIPNDLKFDASDLMVILGNLLDNAITAAEKVKNEPYIKVDISYEKGMMFISIDNSYDGNIIKSNGRLFTTKKNRKQHGYGITNIKKVLEEYHGIIDFDTTDTVFCANAALYCKPSE